MHAYHSSESYIEENNEYINKSINDQNSEQNIEQTSEYNSTQSNPSFGKISYI